MVSIEVVRANNATVKKLGTRLVAVIVGGTSGIGETTAREFVRAADAPRVYLIGRNETQASAIISELKQLNPQSELSFIKSDVSLLRSVDEASNEIKQNEKEVNLLFMSPGMMSTKGRDETREGLDIKFSLHYYSRMRFAMNLMPLLDQASSSGRLSRVVSVLAPGTEARCQLDDLSLKTHYSLSNCATHAAVMNSFAMEEGAKAHPGTTFIHASPGIVETNLLRSQGAWMNFGAKVLVTVLRPWVVPLGQSGERHVYASTSNAFPPQSSAEKDQAVTGSAGVKGSGAYLLGSDGMPYSKEKIMNEYRDQGVGKKIWDHTMEVFDKICGSENGKY